MKLLGGNQSNAAEAEGQLANELDGGTSSQAGLLTGGEEVPAKELSEASILVVTAEILDNEAFIKDRLRSPESRMQEGFSAEWTSRAGTAEIVRLWADEIFASAPARTELDFAEHMMRNLDELIQRLGGRRGIPPT